MSNSNYQFPPSSPLLDDYSYQSSKDPFFSASRVSSNTNTDVNANKTKILESRVSRDEYPTPNPSSSLFRSSSPARGTFTSTDVFKPKPTAVVMVPEPATMEKAKVNINSDFNVLNPDKSVIRIPLLDTHSHFSIGRSSRSCEFALNASDAKISRIHLKISYNSQQVILTCLGSNGVGVIIPKPCFVYATNTCNNFIVMENTTGAPLDTQQHANLSKTIKLDYNHTEFFVQKGETITMPKFQNILLQISKNVILLNPNDIDEDLTDDEAPVLIEEQKTEKIPTQVLDEQQHDDDNKSQPVPTLLVKEVEDEYHHKEISTKSSDEDKNTAAIVSTTPMSKMPNLSLPNTPSKPKPKPTTMELENKKESKPEETPSKEPKLSLSQQQQSQSVTPKPAIPEPVKLKEPERKPKPELESGATSTTFKIFQDEFTIPNRSSSTSPIPQIKHDNHVLTDHTNIIKRRATSEEPSSTTTTTTTPMKKKKKLLKKRQQTPELDNSVLELSNLSEIQNILVNHLAFSRLSSTPASFLNTISVSTSNLSLSQIRGILHNLKSIGVIYREGKDAAGKQLEEEYYYMPENDDDKERKMLVANVKGHGGLRSCRKTHKQYYWKKPAPIKK